MGSILIFISRTTRECGKHIANSSPRVCYYPKVVSGSAFAANFLEDNKSFMEMMNATENSEE